MYHIMQYYRIVCLLERILDKETTTNRLFRTRILKFRGCDFTLGSNVSMVVEMSFEKSFLPGIS